MAKFKHPSSYIKPIKNMKTLFAVDCSRSINGYSNYYSKIRELIL